MVLDTIVLIAINYRLIIIVTSATAIGITVIISIIFYLLFPISSFFLKSKSINYFQVGKVIVKLIRSFFKK